jgi:hypothetical protein
MLIKVLDITFDELLKKEIEIIKDIDERIEVWDPLGMCSHLFSDKIRYYSRSDVKAFDDELYLIYENGRFKTGSYEFLSFIQIKEIDVKPEFDDENVSFIRGYVYIRKGTKMKERQNYKCASTMLNLDIVS